jgi:hypothetical protein
MPASRPTRPAIGDDGRDAGGRITRHADVPPEIVSALRSVCLDLPAAYEERGWVGTRWCIRKRVFAHVLQVAEGWPPAYARAAGSRGPISVLTFRSSEPGLYDHGRARPPFFWPGWWPNLVGMVLDERADWDVVARLLADSYCVLAPKRLVQLLVDRGTDLGRDDTRV